MCNNKSFASYRASGHTDRLQVAHCASSGARLGWFSHTQRGADTAAMPRLASACALKQLEVVMRGIAQPPLGRGRPRGLFP